MSASVGYRAELQRIENDIAVLGDENPFAPPIDPLALTRYVYCLYQGGSIAGDLAALSATERAIDRALPLLVHKGDLYLLKANIAFKLHRLTDVEAALATASTVRDSVEGALLVADLDFQYGHYLKAERGYREALATERSWGALAQLAHLRGKMGNLAAADRLYSEAEDELTAKEMRSYAWLEVQRGFLAFAQGDYRRARSHYERAERAYPGYWLVDEYRAELLGAEGRYGEAVEILQGLPAATGRPDLQQAIGELYQCWGEPERADEWYRKALAGYRLSAERGEVHFFHHLADYYANVARDGAAAVHWAGADLQLRENFSTQSALAWGLYRDGQFGKARIWIDRALASGAADAHLFLRAARIYAAVAEPQLAHTNMEKARRLNPCVENFHIHH